MKIYKHANGKKYRIKKNKGDYSCCASCDMKPNSLNCLSNQDCICENEIGEDTYLVKIKKYYLVSQEKDNSLTFIHHADSGKIITFKSYKKAKAFRKKHIMDSLFSSIIILEESN